MDPADSAVMPFDQGTAPVCCPSNTMEACPTSTIRETQHPPTSLDMMAEGR